jgi:hypothetical protein
MNLDERDVLRANANISVRIAQQDVNEVNRLLKYAYRLLNMWRFITVMAGFSLGLSLAELNPLALAISCPTALLCMFGHKHASKAIQDVKELQPGGEELLKRAKQTQESIERTLRKD